MGRTEGKSRAALVPAMAAILLLLLSGPASAGTASAGIVEIPPSSWQLVQGECAGGSGCGVANTKTDDAVTLGLRTQSTGTRWWSCTTYTNAEGYFYYTASSDITGSATAGSSTVSAIRMHEKASANGGGGGLTTWLYDWYTPVFTGSYYTAPPDQNAYMCNTNAGCTKLVNGSNGLLLDHFKSNPDDCNQYGGAYDYMLMQVEGDLNPPDSSCSSGCTGAWHTSSFTPSITCSDSGTSGGASSGCNIRWCYDTANACIPNSNGFSFGSCAAPCGPTISTNGPWYLRWLAQDNAGNFELPVLAGSIFLPSDGGYIRNWITLGSFAESNACNGGGPATFNADTISTADNYNRVPGFSEAGQTWTARNNGADYHDNGALYGTANLFAYNLAYLWSDTSQTVRLREGSDDTARVYLNGALVITDSTCSGAAVDQQESANVTLNAGWNTLLVRNGNQGGSGWGFYLRVIYPFSGTQCPLGGNCFPARSVKVSQYGTGGAGSVYRGIHSDFDGLDSTAATTTNVSWAVNGTSTQADYVFANGTTLWFSGLMSSPVYAALEGGVQDGGPSGGGATSGINGPNGVNCASPASTTSLCDETPSLGSIPVNNLTRAVSIGAGNSPPDCQAPGGSPSTGSAVCSMGTGHNATRQGYGISSASTEAQRPVDVRVQDVAGTTFNLAGIDYRKDTTAPATSCTSVPTQSACSGTWVTADQTVTLACGDGTGAGCAANNTSAANETTYRLLPYTPSGYTPLSGLAGWWQMDEGSGGTTQDNSGNGNTGTLNGATWNAAGRFGPGITFGAASTDRVTVSSFGSFQYASVSAWIYRTGTTTTRESIVSYKEGTPTNCGFVFLLNEGGSGNNFYPGIYFQVNGNWRFVNGTSAVPLTTWTHLAATYDGITIRLYRNGALESSDSSWPGVMTQCTQEMDIGHRSTLGGGDNQFPGVIDDVRVYGRPLSATEIGDVYASAPGSIRRWDILGPFSTPGCAAPASTITINDNDNLRRPGYTESVGGVSRTWFEHQNGDDIIDFNNEIWPAAPQSNAYAYALVYVWSPNTRTGLLKAGSDDGIRAWLNDALVINDGAACRGVATDQESVAVTLNAGINKLLVETNQGGGDFAFTARFTDSSGVAWTDLRYLPRVYYGNPFFCVDNTNTCTPPTWGPQGNYNQSFSFTCPVNDVCRKYIRYNSVDKVGNAETLVSAAIQIDKLPPVTVGPTGDQGWFKDNQTVILQCSDPQGTTTVVASGCAANNPLWCTDTTNTCTPSNAYTGPITLGASANSVNATVYLRYQSTDVAGNGEAANWSLFHFDRQSPTVAVTGPANGSWFRRDFGATDTDSDGSGSGLTPTAPGGLELWWKFNEGSGSVAGDSSGNGRAGYLATPAVTWNASGWMGPAVNFSTTGSSALSNVSVTNYSGSGGQFSVAAWVYRIGATSNLETIVSYKNSGVGANCGFVLRLNDALGNHYPRIWVNKAGSWVSAENAATVPESLWTHLAATYNSTWARLYRNGVLVASTNTSTTTSNGVPMSQCFGNTTVGNEVNQSPTNYLFPGVIDDVRIWSRAISPDEVATLYNVTGTYRNDTNCYYSVNTSPDGSVWVPTINFTGRPCPSGGGNFGVWSPPNSTGNGPYQYGHGCQNSGPNRCRGTFRTFDNVGNTFNNFTDAYGVWSIDWDSPLVNITGAQEPGAFWRMDNHSWRNQSFTAATSYADQPPGGVAAGLNNCTLRVATMPLVPGPWTLKNWSSVSGAAACAGPQGDPYITLGAGQMCDVPSQNDTQPRWPYTCLAVTGATDALSSGSNPSMLYYPLEEYGGTVATDLGPRGVNGTLTPGATWAGEGYGASFVANGGFFRHGVALNGVSGSVNVSLMSDLVGGPQTNFTVEMWVRPNATASRGLFEFCDPDSTCAAGSDRHIYTDASSNLCMRVWPHIGGTCSVTPLQNNVWNHIALRVQNWTSGGVNYNAATLFRNGTNILSATNANHSDFDWATTFHVGHSMDATNTFFSGLVSDVKVHFRPLNDTEIAWGANGNETGGAEHLLVDYTIPVTTFNSPANLTNETGIFSIDVSDSDPDSGLNICQFQVRPDYRNSPGTISRDWTTRTCNDPQSTTITIGGGQMCNVNATWCRVCVRSFDNAGLAGPNATPGDCREFFVTFFSPNLRIEGPKPVPNLGLYVNASETCKATFPNASTNCSDWWYRRLRERGMAVTNVTLAQIQSADLMSNYPAMVNPYGERFPGLGGSPDLMTGQISSYVGRGGFWFDAGGYSFWDPGTGAMGAAHSQALCLNIGNSTTAARDRSLNASNNTSFPHGPFSTQTSPADLNRPSIDNGPTNCGFDQRFRGTYVNQTGNAYGPAMHCYTKGCIVRTDNVSPDAGSGISPYPVADIYADVIRYWLNSNWTIMVEDDQYVWDQTCSYHIESPAGTNQTGNVSRACDQDVNITVGRGKLCPNEGADACIVFVNATNITGFTSVQLRYGIDWTPPTASLALSTVGPCAYAPNNTWVYYSNNCTIGYFNVDSGASDATSGVARVEFPDATSPGNTTINVPHSWSYTFDPTSTFSDWRAVKVFDAASNPFPSTYLLQGWWRFSDPANQPQMDGSGNARNTSPVGPPSAATGLGGFGSALSFAAGQKENLISFGSFSNFSASAWVFRTGSTSAGEDILSYKEGDAPNCGFNLSLTGNTFLPRLEVKVSGAWQAAQSPIAVPLSAWMNVGGTYDGRTIRLYLNGSQVASQAAPGSMDQCAQNSSIGNRAPGATDRFFPGVIDDVKIWSRTLTSAEFNRSVAALTDESGIGLFRVWRDVAPPAGNTGPDYCGSVPGNCYNTTYGVVMNLPATSDSESGIPAGGHLLYSRNATLSSGACGTFGAWNLTATDPVPLANYNDTTAQHGYCYQYSYNVTDNVNNWANVSSAKIARIDVTPPNVCGPTVNLNSSSYYAYVNGSTVYYNNRFQAGQFNASIAQAVDNESGILNVTFPTTTSAGWANTTPPYSGPYDWSLASSYNSSTNVSCYNNAGLLNNTSFSVLRDVGNPLGNTGPAYTDGFYPVTSVPITLPATSDNLSGIPNNGHILQRREATLSNAVCGVYGPWYDDAYDPPLSYTDANPPTNMSTAHCYQYSYNVTDFVHNWNNTSSTNQAKIDTTAPANGSIDYPDGYYDVPPTIAFSVGDDPESGISSWQIWRREASLDCAGSPGAFGAWKPIVDNPPGSSYVNANVTSATAYQYALYVANGAGLVTQYYQPTGNIYVFQALADPNITKQINHYRWNATFTGANPVEKWALHNNTTATPPDGFEVTQTGSSIIIGRAGQTTPFSGFGVSGPFPETHSYTVVYDYACGSGNYTYVWRDGNWVGRVGGANLSFGNFVQHTSSVNTRVDNMVIAPGRWDPPLTFTSASTNATGCTNYVLDSCKISGALPCVDTTTDPARARSVNGLSVNKSVVRPGSWVQVSVSFTCNPASSNATSISYNPGDGTGWQQVGNRGDCNVALLNSVFQAKGNPGVHRVRASVGDLGESGSWLACRTWSADNDEVAFWVAEPVPG